MNRGSPLRLRVTQSAESSVRKGHPWLFAQSIKNQNRTGRTGEFAVIYDRSDRFLALGLFDAHSPIAVRILHCAKPAQINSSWWQERLDQALLKRAQLLEAVSWTNGFRLINGESDGWPGLVLDRYNQTLVAKIYSAAWSNVWPEVLQLIKARWPAYAIVVRLSRKIQEFMADSCSLRDGQCVAGKLDDERVRFFENGITFEANVVSGQKTGFFLDQRENRARVEKLSRGTNVMNAFSYTGGFSLYAARGGASSVTSLDISAKALEAVATNFALNKNDPTIHKCVQRTVVADAFDWLAQKKQSYELIVLDPPSFAKRESERTTAIRAYRKLANLAVAHLTPGGILVAASCSAHVSNDEFFDAVQNGVRSAKRSFAEIERTFHAVDHPATFPEANYLKCIYLKC